MLSFLNTVSQIQADVGTSFVIVRPHTLTVYNTLHSTTEMVMSNFTWGVLIQNCYCMSFSLLSKTHIPSNLVLWASCSSNFTELKNLPVHNISHKIQTFETGGMLYPSFGKLGRFKVFTDVSSSRGWSCE